MKLVPNDKIKNLYFTSKMIYLILSGLSFKVVNG